MKDIYEQTIISHKIFKFYSSTNFILKLKKMEVLLNSLIDILINHLYTHIGEWHSYWWIVG